MKCHEVCCVVDSWVVFQNSFHAAADMCDGAETEARFEMTTRVTATWHQGVVVAATRNVGPLWPFVARRTARL